MRGHTAQQGALTPEPLPGLSPLPQSVSLAPMARVSHGPDLFIPKARLALQLGLREEL